MSSFTNKLKKNFTWENSAAWRDFVWLAVFGVITLRLAMPVFAESIPAEAGAQDQAVNPAAANSAAGGMVSTQALPEFFRLPGPPAALFQASALENAVNQQLASALVKTAGKAGDLAKTVGQSINDYVKEKQIEKMQEDLVQRFYYNLDFYLDPYRLQPAKRRSIVRKVEEIYIEDGETDKFGLDTVSFREMPGVIKKVYGDLLLEETQNGEVKTYYINGRLRTIWNLRDGEAHGPAVTYYEDSTEILHIDVYEEGRRISRKMYDPLGRLEFEQNYDYNVPEITTQETAEGLLPVSIEPEGPPAASLPAAPEEAIAASVQPENPVPFLYEAE